MPHTGNGGPRIWYEADDNVDAPALVLIEGLGAQLIGWRAGFVDRLRALGLRVIRLDNRDVGLSDQLGEPTDTGPSYTLADMADDVVRVLDACGVAAAHVVGQSMGGGIAQSLAIRHPRRVRSLVLFYTAPVFGSEFVTQAAAERPAPQPGQSRAEAIAARIAGERACASPLYGFDEAWVREVATRSHDRCPRVDGAARQRAALVAAADHRPGLAQLSLPCAVIHGRGDAIVHWQGGVALAEAIPGADLHLFAGMGHVVAEPLWPQFAAIIGGIVARAEARSG